MRRLPYSATQPNENDGLGGMKLTPKQVAFALAYCRLSNASAAYREVYAPKKATDKTINEAASRLLKNSKISARIAQVIEAAAKNTGLSIERTLREVARVSYSDVRKLFDKNGQLIPVHLLDADTAACIASVEVDEINSGEIVIGHTKKIKHWDKNAALEKAMKYHGLYEADNKQTVPVLPPVLNIIAVAGRK